MPHLLAALLTPKCAPHARLPKHWEGRIVSLLVLVRHLLLARFSSLLLILFSLPGFLSPHFLLHPLSSRFPLSRFFSSQNVPPIRFISPGRLRGCSPPQAHPAPLAHGYHDDPCALKKGGRRSSRKIVAEEEWGRASELVKEMCVNVSVVKKKASHKRGDLFFALLNASHLRSH